MSETQMVVTPHHEQGAVSPKQALYVILLYIGIQGVKSYLLTPLVQERTVSLPLPPSPSLHRCYRVFRLGLWG